MKRMLVFILIVAGLTGVLAAQQQEQPASEPVTKPENTLPPLPEVDAFSFVQTLMALTFVLGLIFLGTYLFKKMTGIKNSGLRRSAVPINLIGNRPLGDKKFLVIVEIQEKQFFLGITQDSINMLSELQLDLPEEVKQPEDQSFENILAKARDLLNFHKVKK